MKSYTSFVGQGWGVLSHIDVSSDKKVESMFKLDSGDERVEEQK